MLSNNPRFVCIHSQSVTIISTIVVTCRHFVIGCIFSLSFSDPSASCDDQLNSALTSCDSCMKLQQ